MVKYIYRGYDFSDCTESESNNCSRLAFISMTHTFYLKHSVVVVVIPIITLVTALELPVRRITRSPGISVALAIAAVTLALAAAPESWGGPDKNHGHQQSLQ